LSPKQRVNLHLQANLQNFSVGRWDIAGGQACRLVVQVVAQLEVWDLAVLLGAVRPESDLSSAAVRLAALVPAVVSLVSMWTSEEILQLNLSLPRGYSGFAQTHWGEPRREPYIKREL
jgi:hypothetical protein